MNRPPLTDEDGEVREMTEEDFRDMRPLSDMDPGMIEAMESLSKKNKGGRPKVDKPKVQIAFRLPSDLVDEIKATGKGYNSRVEDVLREAVANGRLKRAPEPQPDHRRSAGH